MLGAIFNSGGKAVARVVVGLPLNWLLRETTVLSTESICCLGQTHSQGG